MLRLSNQILLEGKIIRFLKLSEIAEQSLETWLNLRWVENPLIIP